jgi:hypothetical protein
MINRRGFLLLEVMVSLCIIACGLLVITRAYSMIKFAVDRSSGLFRAKLVMEEKAFILERKAGANMVSSPREPAGQDGYFWRLDVAPLSPPQAGLDVMALDIIHDKSVPGRDAEALETYSLLTYILEKGNEKHD